MSEDGKPLEVGGNVVNNEALTFNGNEWTAAKTLYWDEGLYNVYAYHPYIGRVSSIEDQPFSVSLDQRTERRQRRSAATRRATCSLPPARA